MLLLLLALIHPILRIVKLFRTTSSLSVHRSPSFVHPQLTTMFYCKLLLLFSFSALTQLYFSTNIIVSWSSKTQETTKNILVLSVMYPCFWIASFAGTLPDCETIRVAMKNRKREWGGSETFVKVVQRRATCSFDTEIIVVSHLKKENKPFFFYSSSRPVTSHSHPHPHN